MDLDRVRAALSDVASAAFESPTGSRRALRSLGAALLLAAAVSVVAAGFAKVGAWFVVLAGWAFIGAMLWRFRDRIDVGRLGAAFRDERSRDVSEPSRPGPPQRPAP